MLKINQMRILPLILVCLLSFQGFAQKKVKMKKHKDIEGLSIKMPKDFVFMEEGVLAQKYSTFRRPTLSYTDANNQTDLVINVTINTWGNNLHILKDFYKATIMKIHETVDFKREDVVMINDREYIVFEFDSKILGKKTFDGKNKVVRHYNYLLYTVVNKKIVSVTFRCPHYMKKEWNTIADLIMGSIKITDKLPMPETDKN